MGVQGEKNNPSKTLSDLGVNADNYWGNNCSGLFCGGVKYNDWFNRTQTENL